MNVLCPMCERVGYPVSDCPPCNVNIYCVGGEHYFEDGKCRYCPTTTPASTPPQEQP